MCCKVLSQVWQVLSNVLHSTDIKHVNIKLHKVTRKKGLLLSPFSFRVYKNKRPSYPLPACPRDLCLILAYCIIKLAYDIM